ncbi:MAG: rhomboid family intramembrane serine protease [Prevotellaceae bacterium]|jgi:membrane associated rhomboid family serine protease|nr:rhomboid family intramembrane serine protease [Prevotellaceae bacterium]
MRNLPPAVKNLIIINAVLLLLTTVLERTGFDLVRYLGLFYPGSDLFRPYQLATHMFMHGGLMHLFFNMYALWIFGSALEQVWGSKRFLFYYFVTGMGAAALHIFVSWIEISHVQSAAKALMNTLTPEAFEEFAVKYFGKNINPDTLDSFVSRWSATPENPVLLAQAEQTVVSLINGMMSIPTVGASGAVFGVLLAFGMLFPNTQLMLIFPPIPVKAKYFVIGYGVLELALGLNNPGSNVAHFAHVGGMIFGFLLIKYWQKKSQHFY